MIAVKIRMMDIMQFLTNGNMDITKKYGIPQAKLKHVEYILKEGSWKVVGRVRRGQRNGE